MTNEELAYQYEELAIWCKAKLFKRFHDRHLEDCVQYVAMRVFEYATDFNMFGLRGQWQWYLSDYCRLNGLNASDRSKMGAKTIENSLSIDAPCGESENSEFLLDQESISRSEERETVEGLLEEFLSPLNLKQGVMRWVLKSYKVKMS